MGRLLAIDYGDKRIGLALSDPEKCIASPFKTIENEPGVIENLSNICSENEVDAILIGYPYHLSGDSSEMGQKIDKFKERLEAETGLKIILWDERLSSKESERIIREFNIKPSENKELVDRIAACIILQAYLQYLSSDSFNDSRLTN